MNHERPHKRNDFCNGHFSNFLEPELSMKDMKAEREQEAFRVGFADAQNGTSYAEWIGRFGRTQVRKTSLRRAGAFARKADSVAYRSEKSSCQAMSFAA